MTKTKVFYGGVPTDIDIRKLTDVYPVEGMEYGDKYMYDEVSKLIQTPMDSKRFRTVTNRWRGIIERSTGKRIGAYDGEFFRVMTEQEKLEAIEGKRKSIGTQTRKNIRRVGYVVRNMLSIEEKTRLDHEEMNAKKMIASQQLRGKEKLLPEV